MNFFILAQAAEVAAEAAKAPEAPSGWAALIAMFLGGIVFTKAAGWLAKWLQNAGAELVVDKLAKFNERLNKNEVMAQIHADDAVLGALEAAVPVAFNAAGEGIKAAAMDGKISIEELKIIAKNAWEAAKPHIQGGAHDYLKNSSFSDGEVAAKYVLDRWLAKRKAAQ
jgi:hypothetical protein